jgi:hypothetical protein
MAMADSDLMTRKEAAAYLRLTVPYFKAIESRLGLAAVTFSDTKNARKHYKLADLDRLIDRRTGAVPAAQSDAVARAKQLTADLL